MGGVACLWSQSQLLGVFDSWLEPPWLVLSNILRGACSNILSPKMSQDLFLAWIWREGYNPSPLRITFHQARFSFSCKPLFPFWCDFKKIHNLNCCRNFSSVWKPQWANILGTVAIRKKSCEKEKKARIFFRGKNRLFTWSPWFLIFFLRKGKETQFRKTEHSKGYEMRWHEN